MHAALIGGPQLSGFAAGAEERRDCAGRLWPAVPDALPALSSETAIQLAIRAAGHVRGVLKLLNGLPQIPADELRVQSTRSRVYVFKAKFDLLLGRKTYEIFAAYWPYYDEDAPHGGIAKPCSDSAPGAIADLHDLAHGSD